MRKKIFFIVLFFLTFGCKKENASLEGNWVLVSIENVSSNNSTLQPANIKQSITFIDSTSTLLFHGACNSGSGTYFIKGNTITIEGIGTTKKYCLLGLSTWEGYLYDNLIASKEFYIKGNQLTIKSSGSYNLIFEKNL